MLAWFQTLANMMGLCYSIRALPGGIADVTGKQPLSIELKRRKDKHNEENRRPDSGPDHAVYSDHG